MNRDNAAISPVEVMSLVLDCAYQSAFRLTNFVTITKETKGNALKVNLIEFIEHGAQNRVKLYTMMEKFETTLTIT